MQQRQIAAPQSTGTSPTSVEDVGNATRRFETSIPPGAHEDSYRVIQSSSASNPHYAEYQYWTTSSMTEGIRVMPQPPWYYGRTNTLKPADTNILNSATRYNTHEE